MLIDDFINSGKRERDKSGGTKKCFVFDEYVLLYGGFKEEELQQEMQIGKELQILGVQLIPTLEYKVVLPPNELGYSRGYMLQQRAKGTWLYSWGMKEDEYKQRLSEIAELGQEKIDKFVSDWMKIIEAGLQVDPSKTENFFYDNGNITFIDLNLRKVPINFQYAFWEVTEVLMGLGLKSKEYSNDLAKVIKKVSHSFVKIGLPLKEISEIITTKWNYILTESQVISIMQDLMAEQNKVKTNTPVEFLSKDGKHL